MRFDPSNAVLLLIDMQERLFSVMPESSRGGGQRAVENLAFLAKEIGIPTMVTEQYPRGLGPSLAGMILDGAEVFEKSHFAATSEPGFGQRLDAIRAGRSLILVCGQETHICVAMTVLGLRAQGLEVGVVSDGCLSRREEDRRYGLELMAQHGAMILPSETVLFGMIEKAGTPLFKEISRRIR